MIGPGYDMPELIGRGHESSRTAALLDAAAAGCGSTVVIRGVAGIGKTSLLDVLASSAIDRGLQVLRCRGDPLEREFPWGGVQRLLEGRRLREPRTGREADLDPAPRDGASLMAALHWVYWRIVEFAQAAPVLLVVDDAHWLDDLSLRWLAYMAARVDEEPVLLAVATRPGVAEQDATAWGGILSAATVLNLAPLRPDETARLIAARLGESPDPEFCSACQAETKGNPFLLSEILTEMRVQRTAPTRAAVTGITSAARARTGAVALRLTRLGRDSRHVAQAVAVLGPQATPRRVAAVCELELDATEAAVERLVDDGFLHEGPELSFVHPLIRTAAYDDLGALQRSRYHRRSAEVLAAPNTEPEVAAAHLLRSLPTSDPWVVRQLSEAAERAEARGAPLAAAEYLSRALDESPEAAERPGLMVRLARAETTGDPAAAAERFGEVLRRAAGTSAELTARLGLADALSFMGRFLDAAEVLDAGLLPPAAPDPAAADALLAALLNTARWDLAARPRCVAHVRDLKRRSLAGESLPVRLRANLAIELLAEGVDREWMLREAMASAPLLETEGPEGAMWLPLIVTPITCGGHPELAHSINARHIERMRQQGWTRSLSIALSASGKTLIWCGDISGALVDLEEAVETADDPLSIAYGVTFLAEALRLRDELDAAWALLERHRLTGELPDVWPFPLLLAERAWLRYAREGDGASTLADLQAFGRWNEKAGFAGPFVMPWRSRAAAVAAALGDADQAGALADRELEIARRWGEPRMLGYALRGLAAVATGSERLGLLQEAVTVLRSSAGRLELAEALIDLGAALRRRGHRREAREPLREALHIANRGGALAARRRATDELLAAGGRPRRASLLGRDALTPSELRVARLAAKGRSNPEIANLLFVTRRTVETHLTQAYRKLDVRARNELAQALDAPTAPLMKERAE